MLCARDDFPAFFTARFERLLKQIEEATGKPVNRSADGDNPYAAAANAEVNVVEEIRRVASGGESKVVEFKSTARKNLKTGEKDPAMEYAVVKSVAGVVDGRTVARIAVWPAARPVFLNAKGEKKGVFLVRVNSSTRELSGDDAFTYQQKRWPS